jgi:hypothetical protein
LGSANEHLVDGDAPVAGHDVNDGFGDAVGDVVGDVVGEQGSIDPTLL